MGKPTGFLEIPRQDRGYKAVSDRITGYREFVISLTDEALSQQGARCMDCGIPFCHQGCPVNNIIPDWNDLVYNGDYQMALEVLHSTNNFPEFTGRICPAPCEAACTLNIEDIPVTIKTIECAIVDKGWENNWIKPVIAKHKTNKKVAIIGSGPAGMACAQQLARAGHNVSLYEKNKSVGGLLRYGIPDFKMEKSIIDRRVAQMRSEGVNFHMNTFIGSEKHPAQKLLNHYDAIVLTGGAELSRDLPLPGRSLEGIHYAMEFLPQQNKRNANETINEQELRATAKHVVVIGGGDTGSDCIGTSIRQGAASVTQLEIMDKPPEKEDKATEWPNWPNKLRRSSSQEEGCEQYWNVETQVFLEKTGHVRAIQCIEVAWQQDEHKQWKKSEVPNSAFELKADLVLLAMGFVHPVHDGLLEQLKVEKDKKGNVLATMDNYKTSEDKVFVAGDMRRGQSLVVWAIREGREAAKAVDQFLIKNKSRLA